MPGRAKTPEARARQLANLTQPRADGTKPGHTLSLRPHQIEKIQRIKKSDRLLEKAIATLPEEFRSSGIKTFGEFTRAWVDSLPDE